mmetsp:Transcript_21248/g.49909  ORF Transcript_21248/g.49909 Transcript_21248/m.49909 type:complete len:690 (+) Transcript_21248:51-2120(+)
MRAAAPSMDGDRSFFQRVQRYWQKGLRRSRTEKLVYIGICLYQLLTFWLMAIFLPWLAAVGVSDGNIQEERSLDDVDFDQITGYYAAIIALGAIFSLLLGLSGVLRSNVFEMIASIFSSVLSCSRILVVLVDGIRLFPHPKRSATLLAFVLLQMVILIVSGALVIKSFGWSLYLKVGSHKHLRGAFTNFLLFCTCMEVDVIFVTFLGVAGLVFFFEGFEIALCILGILFDYIWSLGALIVVRREMYAKCFPYVFGLAGILVPTYFLYKIVDLAVLRADHFRENTPRWSLILTAVLAIVDRVVILLYGLRCWASFGIGLRERLDEIGMIGGGPDAAGRRAAYKRDKMAGVNVNRQKALAQRTLGMLQGGKQQNVTLTAAGWSAKSQTQKVNELTLVFNLFDSDHSGSIDVDELFVAMKSMGHLTTKQEAESMISELDVDGSGTVDFDEFFDMMDLKMTRSEEKALAHTNAERFNALSAQAQLQELHAVFDKYDPDKTGYVEVDNIIAALKSVGILMERAEYLRVITPFDKYSEGSIAFDGFKTLVSRHSKGDAKGKLEEMNQRLLAQEAAQATHVAVVGPRADPDASLLPRLQLADAQRLKLMKLAFPTNETMALAKEYKDIAQEAQGDRTEKLASFWAKDLHERCIKQRKIEAAEKKRAKLARPKDPAGVELSTVGDPMDDDGVDTAQC